MLHVVIYRTMFFDMVVLLSSPSLLYMRHYIPRWHSEVRHIMPVRSVVWPTAVHYGNLLNTSFWQAVVAYYDTYLVGHWNMTAYESIGSNNCMQGFPVAS